MATWVADTIKPKASFPAMMAEDVRVSDTDTRTVKKAIEDIGGTAASTSSLGLVKVDDAGLDIATDGTLSLDKATTTDIGGVVVGEGIDLDTTTAKISVPYYAAVGDTEPADKNLIWIDTKAIYSSTGEPIDISTDEGNLITTGSDNGLLVKTKGQIDGVDYINDIPFRLNKSITLYIDYDNGSNSTGDGTSSNPYQTWNGIASLIPHDLNGYILSLYISGTNFVTNQTIINFNYLNNGQVIIYPVSTPTFYMMTFSFVDYANINAACSFNCASCTTTWQAGIKSMHGSFVYLNAKITITGVASTSYSFCGLAASFGGQISARYMDSSNPVTINNCNYALYADWGGEIWMRNILKGTGNIVMAQAGGGAIHLSITSAQNTLTATTRYVYEGGYITTTST